MSELKKILFVRSGGGLPGLDIHAGIWRALQLAGIEATHCSGTSAGAIVSAFDTSSLIGALGFANLIEGLRDDDVRAERWLWKLRVPFIGNYLENYKIQALLHTWICADFPTVKQLQCWSVNSADGSVQNVARPELAEGPAVAALASMSICGVFPPVRLLDGNDYFDGGPAANLPLPPVLADFDEVWLLVATGRRGTYQRDESMLTRLIHNVHWMMDDQIQDAIALARKLNANVRVIWPDLPTPGGALHFDHALIDQAYNWTREYLGSFEEKETP